LETHPHYVPESALGAVQPAHCDHRRVHNGALFGTYQGAKRQGRKALPGFWDAFRGNFRQATIIWLLIVLAAFVFTTDIVYFFNMGGFLGTFSAMIFVGLDVILLLMSLYVFPMQAVFDNSIATTMKSALLLLSRYLGWSVVLLALAILAAIAVIVYWPLIWWFIFGLVAFINAWIFDRIFRRYYPKEEHIQP
jgi:uncharacterized membrane protein YesL